MSKPKDMTELRDQLLEAFDLLREIRRRGFDLVQGHVVAPFLLVGVVPD